jgi:hypothetical protein
VQLAGVVSSLFSLCLVALFVYVAIAGRCGGQPDCAALRVMCAFSPRVAVMHRIILASLAVKRGVAVQNGKKP